MFILIGPYNLSGNWSGLMGDVVTGRYPIGLSTWRWTIERHIVGDFNVILSSDYKTSYLVLQRPQMDPEFFTRSFSNLSWIFIFTIFGAQFFILKAMQLIKNCNEILSERFQAIIELSVWFMFVILYSYYSGALTTFFAVKPSLPFETIEDAMLATPNWKVLISKGEENAFRHDKNIGHYWKFVDKYPDQYLVDSIEEAITSLNQGQNVYHGLSQQVTKFINENQDKIPSSIETLQREKSNYYSLLLTKNSPLMPYFKKVAYESIQFGLTEAVIHEWIGSEIKAIHEKGTHALTIGQTFIIFAVLLGFILVSLLIYAIEVSIAMILRND